MKFRLKLFTIFVNHQEKLRLFIVNILIVCCHQLLKWLVA